MVQLQFGWKTFTNIGDSVLMPYQLKTFQGTRYALFAYNPKGKQGGYADFDNFLIDEPLADRSKTSQQGKLSLFSIAETIPVYMLIHTAFYISKVKELKNMKQKIAVSVCMTGDRGVWYSKQ